jgi:hypothetical protein
MKLEKLWYGRLADAHHQKKGVHDAGVFMIVWNVMLAYTSATIIHNGLDVSTGVWFLWLVSVWFFVHYSNNFSKHIARLRLHGEEFK